MQIKSALVNWPTASLKKVHQTKSVDHRARCAAQGACAHHQKAALLICRPEIVVRNSDLELEKHQLRIILETAHSSTMQQVGI